MTEGSGEVMSSCTSFWQSTSGVSLFTRIWYPSQPQSTAALLFIVHGLHGHSGPFGEMAESLASQNILSCCHDNYGHGKSEGKKVSPPNFEVYVEDTLSHARQFRDEVREQWLDLASVPMFLLGHSLGGLIALHAAHTDSQSKDPLFKGLILLSPALTSNDDVSPLAFLKPVLMRFYWVAPWLPIPTNMNVEQFTSCPLMQEKHTNDDLNYHGMPLLGHVHDILIGMEQAERFMKDFRVPYLLLFGSDDEICPLDGGKFFHRATDGVKDKTFLLYDKLRHNLFMEIKEERLKVFRDMQSWILARV